MSLGKIRGPVELPRIEVQQEQVGQPAKGLPTSKKVLDQIKNSKGVDVLKTIGRGTVGVLGWARLVVVSLPVLVIWYVIGSLPLKIKASADGKQHIYGTHIQTQFLKSYRQAYSKIFNWIKG